MRLLSSQIEVAASDFDSHYYFKYDAKNYFPIFLEAFEQEAHLK
jgi:hypothetical protein